MQYIKIILACLILTLTSACQTTGNMVLENENKGTIASKLKEGMNKYEVREIFGDPMTTSFTDGGNTIWTYRLVKAQIKGSTFVPIVSLFDSGYEGISKELVILFDSEDKVKKFNMSESQLEADTAVIQ